MFKLRQYDPLVNYRVDTPFGEYSSLCHLFHSKYFIILLECDFPDFSETSFANAVEEIIMCFRDDNSLLIINVIDLELTIPHYYILT